MTDPNAVQPESVQPAAPAVPPAPGYTPPAPGYPAPAQGYATPQGYPAPQGYAGQPQPYGVPNPYALQPSGRKYWGLLFLTYIPYVGGLVALIVALVQRGSAKNLPYPIMRDNARNAANWMLSYVLYFIVILLLLIIFGVGTMDSRTGDPSPVIILPAVLLLALGIYHLVTMIRGTVISDRVVHRPALSIPFFRA